MASSLKRPTLSFFPTSHFVPLPIRASIPTVLTASLPYGFVFKAAYPVFFPHFSFRPPPNPRFNPNRPFRFSPLWLRLQSGLPCLLSPLLISSPSQSALQSQPSFSLLSPMASSLKRPTLSSFPTSHFVPLPIRASIPTVLFASLPYGFVFKAAYPVFFAHFSFRPPPNPRFNPNRPFRSSPLWLRF